MGALAREVTGVLGQDIEVTTGVVTAFSGAGVTVLVNAGRVGPIKRLVAAYPSPVVGDNVLVVRANSSWTVLGKIG